MSFIHGSTTTHSMDILSKIWLFNSEFHPFTNHNTGYPINCIQVYLGETMLNGMVDDDIIERGRGIRAQRFPKCTSGVDNRVWM